MFADPVEHRRDRRAAQRQRRGGEARGPGGGQDGSVASMVPPMLEADAPAGDGHRPGADRRGERDRAARDGSGCRSCSAGSSSPTAGP